MVLEDLSDPLYPVVLEDLLDPLYPVVLEDLPDPVVLEDLPDLVNLGPKIFGVLSSCTTPGRRRSASPQSCF